MKRPFLTSEERTILREAPESLEAQRIEIRFNVEIWKRALRQEVYPFLFYIALILIWLEVIWFICFH